MKLVGRGSTKDLYVSESHPNHVIFEFSDRVSVFDYGALPDAIPDKGPSLERAARSFFSWFEAVGLKTAFDPVVSAQLGKCALRAARHPKFADVASKNASLEFIPLEVIFRWGVVPGSSLLKRDPALKPYTRFDHPLVEFSTKLEAADRLLDDAEAAQLAGTRERLDLLRLYAQKAAELLRDGLKSCGLELWDGKIECAVDVNTGEIVMVDAITPDELRVSLPGLESVPLSKELLRQWLGGTNWAFEVLQAKKKGGDAWRSGVSKPPRLGAWRLEKLGALYANLAECIELKNSKSLLEWVRRDSRKPRVFVLGEGGRETALRWRLEREGCESLKSPEGADLVWVSQDADLDAGKVDAFMRDAYWTYGPVAAGARIESSKAFGKHIANKAGVKLPRYSDNPAELRSFGEPPVVKLDGLAAGKGVVVADDWNEAELALKNFSGKGKIILEERCRGFEASAFFAVETGYNGIKTRFLGSARDFKRRYQSDEGPNTGGMGAHAPHPRVTSDDVELFRTWAQRTAEALVAEGIPYNGIIYIGALKDDKKGWVLLEYNARLGDPETEALVCAWPEVPLLRQLLKLDVRIDHRDIELTAHAICVALVRPEYPEKASAQTLPPWELPEQKRCVLFRNPSALGRVAFAVGSGDTLLDAGDAVFGMLVHSPWKDILEWRADIIP